MNKLLISLAFIGGCFDLDMRLYTECETQEACVDGLVCASGYCVTPAPDQIACGNGRIEAEEVCDDGDTLSTAPCFADCSKLCRSLDLDGQSGVAINDDGTLKTGLIAGAPASVQIWIRPNFPQGQTFEWTLLSKEPDPGGDPVRIDLTRTSAGEPPMAVMLIRDQVTASIELPHEQVWTNIAFEMSEDANQTTVTPYLNGRPGIPKTLQMTFAEEEAQTGDLYLGSRSPNEPGASYRYLGQIGGLGMSKALVFNGPDRPETTITWHVETPQPDGYVSVPWKTTNIGEQHGPSGDRLMWRPHQGHFYPLWLDEGFKLATVEPQCVHGFQCGDGVRAPYEECDDGNTQSGDGCSAKCHRE